MHADEKNWISLEDAALRLKITRVALLKKVADREPNIVLGWKPSGSVILHSVKIIENQISWTDNTYSDESPDDYIFFGTFRFDLVVSPEWASLFPLIYRGGGPYDDPFLLQEPLIIYDCVNKCYLSLDPPPGADDPNIHSFPRLQELVICNTELVKYENDQKLPKNRIQKTRVNLIKEYLKKHNINPKNEKNEKGKKGILSILRDALLDSKDQQGNYIFASTKPNSNKLPSHKSFLTAWSEVLRDYK